MSARSEIDELALGAAAIAAAFAKTMQQRDPEFGLHMVENLEKAFTELRGSPPLAMRMIKLTGELIETL